MAYSGSGSTVGGNNISDDAYIFTEDALTPYELTVDETKPTTTVQIKLHDGKRLKLK